MVRSNSYFSSSEGFIYNESYSIFFWIRDDFSILSVDGLAFGLSWSINLIKCDSYFEKRPSIGLNVPATTA